MPDGRIETGNIPCMTQRLWVLRTPVSPSVSMGSEQEHPLLRILFAWTMMKHATHQTSSYTAGVHFETSYRPFEPYVYIQTS